MARKTLVRASDNGREIIKYRNREFKKQEMQEYTILRSKTARLYIDMQK